MDDSKIDLFLASKAKYFETEQLPHIKNRLKQLSDSQFDRIQFMDFKDPSTMLLVSIFGGGLAIDRFLIGDTTMALLKLLTCGGFQIWTIIDWFLITGLTKKKNYEKIAEVIG